MSKYNIADDLKTINVPSPKLSPIPISISNMVISKMMKKRVPIDGLKESVVSIEGYKGGMIDLIIVEPESIEANAPCIYYIHGGGFMLKASAEQFYITCEYALKTPCKLVFVDYRVAPKHPFPVGVEDCYAGLKWVFDNADRLSIDKDRIAISGDSAGGALSAAVTLMNRDRNLGKLCFQLLIYPVTDRRQITESAKNYTDTPVWNAVLSNKMWKIYLKNGIGEHVEYASPMEAPNFENLPKAYIEVSEFDCLIDEGIAYSEALKNAGIETEFYLNKGGVHGFEMAGDCDYVREAVKRRIDVFKKVFYNNL